MQGERVAEEGGRRTQRQREGEREREIDSICTRYGDISDADNS